MEAIVCHIAISQYTILSTLLCMQMVIAVSHWAGLRPLASAHHQFWTLPRTPLCYPAVALCHESLQLQQFIGGVDAGVGQPWIWAWVVVELSSIPALPYPHHQGELSSTALASSSDAGASKGQSQLLFSSPPASSPALMTEGPALPR